MALECQMQVLGTWLLICCLVLRANNFIPLLQLLLLYAAAATDIATSDMLLQLFQ